jgi:hypothetical protein
MPEIARVMLENPHIIRVFGAFDSGIGYVVVYNYQY